MLVKFLPLLFIGLLSASPAAARFERDVLETADRDLAVTFIGHATLMIEYHGKVIHVDPWTRLVDYADLPKADLILITHSHPDHLDTVALARIRTPDTRVIVSESCRAAVPDGIVMQNGESRTELGVGIAALPAYNLVHKRDSGEPFHPRGEGNGYLLTLGATRLYIAGDTENIPEIKKLQNIDYAFLPMNLPYTMTPAMVADAVRGFRPKVLYPYHYGDTDPKALLDLLSDLPEVEVRIRRMK